MFISNEHESRGVEIHLGRDEGVLVGWEKGLIGVCAGDLVRLIIPPHMAYGDDGMKEDVPAGATVRFEIKVLSVVTNAPDGHQGTPVLHQDLFSEIDTDGNARLCPEELGRYFAERVSLLEVNCDKARFSHWPTSSHPECVFNI
jgi:FKBP-type peptidyl-prolyl cis-trans isomerase 2